MTNIMKRNNENGGQSTLPSLSFGGVLDNVIENTINSFFDDSNWGFKGVLAPGQVPVNIHQTDKTYEIDVIAPGLRKEDFNVALSKNMLTVSFDHKQEQMQENKQNGYLRQEYRMQSFKRNFTLDDTVNAEQIAATYKDGILRISLPKKEEAQQISKTINIQ